MDLLINPTFELTCLELKIHLHVDRYPEHQLYKTLKYYFNTAITHINLLKYTIITIILYPIFNIRNNN